MASVTPVLPTVVILVGRRPWVNLQNIQLTSTSNHDVHMGVVILFRYWLFYVQTSKMICLTTYLYQPMLTLGFVKIKERK